MMDEKDYGKWIDLGHIEDIEGFDVYIEKRLAEKQKIIDEQQATIERMQEENLYKNFELKSVDDLKKLKDIFEICMILIDGAIADEDLELGYESVFQFERRIKKFDEGRIWERVRGYATDD